MEKIKIHRTNWKIHITGGSLENFLIWSHFYIKSFIVSFKPELLCTKLVNCSIFTDFMPSSTSTCLLKYSSFAFKYVTYYSSPYNLFLASFKLFVVLVRSMSNFSLSNWSLFNSDNVPFLTVVKWMNFFSFSALVYLISVNLEVNLSTSSLKLLKFF